MKYYMRFNLNLAFHLVVSWVAGKLLNDHHSTEALLLIDYLPRIFRCEATLSLVVVIYDASVSIKRRNI